MTEILQTVEQQSQIRQRVERGTYIERQHYWIYNRTDPVREQMTYTNLQYLLST